MKQIILALGFAVLASVSLLAVEPSVTYMPLTQSAQFQQRVIFNIALMAPVVETEGALTNGTITYTASCHTKRANLAASVAANPAAWQSVFAANLVTNVNITTGGALTGAGATLDSPATDASLLAAVASQWSNIAGCVTNP